MRGARSFHAADLAPAPPPDASFSLVTDLREAKAVIGAMRDSLRPLCAPFEPNPPSDDAFVQVFRSSILRPLLNNYELRACSMDQVLDASLRYVFEHCRSAVYVLIVNEHLRVFLPLCNAHFTNRWDLQRLQPRATEDGSMPGYLADPRRWWCNAGVLCNVKQQQQKQPMWSFDLLEEYYVALVDALRTMRREGVHVSWCEFFLNKRDHPLVRLDGGVHPYMCGPYADRVCDLMSAPRPMLPMFSPYTNMSCFADLPVPLAADLKVSAPAPAPAPSLLRDRKLRAVWRGTATGFGVTPESNPRLRIATMHDNELLDARLVGLNERDKVDPFSGAMVRIDVRAFSGLDVGKHHFLTHDQMNEYAVQIYIPGHAAASRLATLLGSGSVVLMVQPDERLLRVSPFEMWYTRFLQDNVHYLSVRNDLSNLLERIQFVLRNLQEAQVIADNARSFYERHLTRSFSVGHVLPAMLQDVASLEYVAFGDTDASLPASTTISDMRELLADSL